VVELSVAAIRESLQKGRAVGGDEFIRTAEAILNRPVRIIPPGRPAKNREKVI
jgi:hypothetical protein